jgi:hypothetical protein
MGTFIVKRGLALVCLVAAVVAGCSTTAVAPTPQIVYVTAPPQPPPTPLIVYVTPEPATPQPSPSASVQHTITGTFRLLTGYTTVKDSGSNSCHGKGGFSDIAPGAPVAVRDGTGVVIATGSIAFDAAWSPIVFDTVPCDFTFAIQDVPDTGFYSIDISHRKGQPYSKADLSSAGWHVDLTLGG